MSSAFAPAGAGAQHHGQQLGVGKCLCAAFQQAFARSLAARPGIDVAGALLANKLLIHRAIMTLRAVVAEPPIGRVSSISALQEGMVQEPNETGA